MCCVTGSAQSVVTNVLLCVLCYRKCAICRDERLVVCVVLQEVRNLQPALEVSLKQATHAITGMLLSKIGQDKQGQGISIQPV